VRAIAARHRLLGDRFLYCEGAADLLFTENETNTERAFDRPNEQPYVKDGIIQAVVRGNKNAVNPELRGTKASAHYRLAVPAKGRKTVRLRLTDLPPDRLQEPFGDAFDAALNARQCESDRFYETLTPATLSRDQAHVMRQALGAAREGKFDQAEELGREAARKFVPEAYLLLAMVAEMRGELNGAVDLVRKALYLDSQLAQGHAALVSLYTRLNRREDAERARQNALRALEGLEDEHQLRGVETMTAGGLRLALASRSRTGW
jgi:tetratricopeptide (TPR) repeat protein